MEKIYDKNKNVLFEYDPTIKSLSSAIVENINQGKSLNNLHIFNKRIETNSFLCTKLNTHDSHFFRVSFFNLDFNGCDFKGSYFKQCIFELVWFENANLSNCIFEDCVFNSSQFKFKGSNIVGLRDNIGNLIQLWQKDNISQGGTTVVSPPATFKITASQIQTGRFTTSENLTISKNADGSFNTWKLESATSDQILEYAYDLVYKRDAKNSNVGINKLREAWQKLNPNQKLPLLLK